MIKTLELNINSKSRAWCKTIVITLFTNCNSFALSPQYTILHLTNEETHQKIVKQHKRTWRCTASEHIIPTSPEMWCSGHKQIQHLTMNWIHDNTYFMYIHTRRIDSLLTDGVLYTTFQKVKFGRKKSK